MRLILNVIWLLFGGLWMAARLLLAALDLLPADRHHPVRLRVAAHRLVRAVAVRPHDRRQANRRHRRAHRQRHLGAAVRVVAGDRPLGERGRDGRHDRRHSAGAGQPQAHPGIADAAGQADRARRLALPVCNGARMTLTALGLPTMPGRVEGAGTWPHAGRRAAGRHLRPGRDRSAGVADRSLQSALQLLHAGRGPGLAARRATAAARRAGQADAHRGHPPGRHQRAVHRWRAVVVTSPGRGGRRRGGICGPARRFR